MNFSGAKYFLVVLLFSIGLANAQPVTGVWRGRVVKGKPPFAISYKVEVKVIVSGDSLTGTSYYYASKDNYYRYAISGYLDAQDGSLHWWDSQLLEQSAGNAALSAINRVPLWVQADFNCPGPGIMKLDGEASANGAESMAIHLDKYDNSLFSDGWDPLIANWLYGGSHPDAIAEAGRIQAEGKKIPPPITQPGHSDVAITKPAAPAPPPAPVTPAPVASVPVTPATVESTAPKVQSPLPKAEPVAVLTNQKRFETRQRLVQTTIPVAGDTIELHFYDNAEIDGDSIAIFLNDKLLMEHVLLSASPFVLKLPVASLPPRAELSMVAENLGSIPPNTAFMIAYVNGQRYSARLESTEGTTAVIRLTSE